MLISSQRHASSPSSYGSTFAVALPAYYFAMAPFLVPGLPATTLPTLLALLPIGLVYYTPVLDAAGEVVDFQFAYLNAAVQRLLDLPVQPTTSYLEQWPGSAKSGAFAFHRDTYLAGTPAQLDQVYPVDGADVYVRAYATRLGNGLLVSFTDGTDQARTAAEQALRASQAREQAVRTEAEAALREARRQRTLLEQILRQSPAYVAAFSGPHHVYSFFNESFSRVLTQGRAKIGHAFADLFPELVAQGFLTVLDGVYASGQVVYMPEAVVVQYDPVTQQDRTNYVNVVYKPLHDEAGHTLGLLAFAIDTTETVLARQQVQQLNEELELRVAARTAETRAALHEAEQQREQLRTQQALLDQILGQVPAVIATFRGPEHRLSFFNDTYQHIAGGRVAMGKTVAEALPETVEQGFVALLDQVYASGQPYHGTEIAVLLAQPTGPATQHYFDFTYQPLTDAHGQRQGVLAFAVDVTTQVRARKQAEALQAALRAGEQRRAQEREELYQVFEQAPVIVAQLRGPDHFLQYHNPAFQVLFPDRQLAGRPYADAMPEVVAAGLMPVLDRVYATGEPFFGTSLPFVATPGGVPQERYYDFSYYPYLEQGHPAGISIFAYDVTEQVLARREREVQRQQLTTIFEQVPVPITVLRGPALVVESANAAISALWGRPAAQTVGRPYFEAVPDTAGQGFEEILTNVLHTGDSFLINEMPVTLDRAHTGRPAMGHFNFVFQALYGPDGTGAPVGIVAVGTEVTDQVLARQAVERSAEQAQAQADALAAANRQLTRTNADLDNFIYTASHDLKAPIANIEGLLYLLQEELPAAVAQAAEVSPVLARMLEAVERFKRTIDHLTEVSKLQKEHAPALAPVDLAAVVADVCQDLAPLLQESNARLTVAVANFPAILFSEKNLRSVVYNLLSNALKYRHPARRPHVDVQAHVRAGHTVLEVHDNGLGLDAAHLPRLFTMFQRFHSHVEGTGIGLFMVKRMVDNAGGRIDVHSQPGAGTTFFVHLPHAPAAPPLPPALS